MTMWSFDIQSVDLESGSSTRGSWKCSSFVLLENLTNRVAARKRQLGCEADWLTLLLTHWLLQC